MVTLRRPQFGKAWQIFRDGLDAAEQRIGHRMTGLALAQGHVRGIAVALALVAGLTLCLLGVTQFIVLHHVSSIYLIPVLAAAIRLGIAPAIAAAVGGIAASAFFFYEPIYDFRVSQPEHILDLILFVIVAAMTGELAARARTHALVAEERESEMRALYAFSKRLAVATDPGQIYAAIEDHLNVVTGWRVIYFDAGASALRREDDAVPELVRAAVRDWIERPRNPTAAVIEDAITGTAWMVRPVSQRNLAFGLVAIDLGRVSQAGRSSAEHPTYQRITAVLADAEATLERLDVARAIGEAKLRAEAETLREALMGSVSHGLRTPLASIMGSASILVQAPAIAQEPRLAGLAGIVRDEAERLNSDIERLLEASRISSASVRPHKAWAEVADIVNAAMASQRRNLTGHRVAVQLPEDLPLVHVDAVMIEQALVQVLDNAAKYAPRGSPILIEVHAGNAEIAISVTDQGAGMSDQERERAFERFYRGARTAASTSGSGLGLWIAHAFAIACGGRLEVASAGIGRGTTATLVLPVTEAMPTEHAGGQDA